MKRLCASRSACFGIGSLVLVLAGCGPARQHVEVAPEATPAPPEAYVQTGVSSWYGQQFAGRRTASGEIFIPSKLTAAHRTLPMGSEVKITNLDNGRCVRVRINDRGPFARGRVLDCSEAAARQLGFRRKGVARVAIEWPDSVQPIGQDADYWVQLGAFEKRENAEHLKSRLAPHTESVQIHARKNVVRVRSGPYEKRSSAEAALDRLQEAGFRGSVVMLDAKQELVR